MTTQSAPQAPAELDLAISGMTCASCAARIEKKLGRLDGVEASVNFATEHARVRYAEPVTIDQLLQTVEAAGYHASLPAPPANGAVDEAPAAPDEAARLRTRLTVTWALALPVIVLSMVPAIQFDNWQWLALVLASPAVVWGGLPFHRAAWSNLRHGASTMDTLVSIGTLAAYAWSLWALFFGSAGDPGMRSHFSLTVGAVDGASVIYLEAAAGVTAFLLTGRYLEARSKRSAGAALRALLELGAKDVAVLRSGVEERIPVDDLRVGDRFLVRPGEKIATDGVVEDGSSALDTSMMTGEPVPREVQPGGEVIGGTVNTGGRLVVRATRVGADTALAQIGRLVSDAQSGKASVQRLADRVAAVFVPVVLGLAAVTFIGWLMLDGSVLRAFTAAVAVLVIACPCALGLATPTALLVGSGRGAQLGILIKGPEVLEQTRTVDTVVLDKTGTVTTGRMSVQHVVAAEGADADEVLAVAGAVEDASTHPIARAIAARAAAQAGLSTVESFASVDGFGVTGVVDGRAAVAGRPRLLEQWSIKLPDDLQQQFDRMQVTGQTVVAVGWDGVARGLVAVADTVKPSSRAAVDRLRALGLTPVLLTGDHERAARAVADQVGIDEVIAGVLPAGKAQVVQRLQAEGKVVAMVGDGVNDAAALAQADLGIAMGTGTDVAIEAGDLTLMRDDLRGVVDAIRLSRRTLGVIKGNLAWAFAYNVAGIPLAMAGLLDPMFAGFAMAASSVLVVTNSLRLRQFSTSR
ncbi:heavy metal translocating P-type ATPase [Leekyejoonella antrihumi]|uniref:Cation-transporting P-type ATPase B n=1 Tax=Leekyejoonella antrihumi TaxID=1660198 RepID=A0A563E956_9MICO|nr:heavy metal translocating P-type ATPase [Leekyejoonella antrihumi]TWP39050.1 copper-translocating P-type ATPase [Leekyejoonella antrihumi]